MNNIYEEEAIRLFGMFERVNGKTYNIGKKEAIRRYAKICAEEISKMCPYLDSDKRENIPQFRASEREFSSYWDQVILKIDKL